MNEADQVQWSRALGKRAAAQPVNAEPRTRGCPESFAGTECGRSADEARMATAAQWVWRPAPPNPGHVRASAPALAKSCSDRAAAGSGPLAKPTRQSPRPAGRRQLSSRPSVDAVRVAGRLQRPGSTSGCLRRWVDPQARCARAMRRAGVGAQRLSERSALSRRLPPRADDRAHSPARVVEGAAPYGVRMAAAWRTLVVSRLPSDRPR